MTTDAPATTPQDPAHAGKTPARLPVLTIAGAGLAAAMAVGAAAVAIASVSFGEASAAITGAGSAMIGCVLGALAMAAVGSRDAMSIATAVLAGSTARMLGSLAIVGGAFVLLSPPATVFWGAFLASALAALFAETLVAARALKPVPAEHHSS